MVGAALLLLAAPVVAQRVRGEVRDAATGAAVSFASVAIVGQGIGTIADEQGHYELDPGSTAADAPVVVSCVGFETGRLTLAGLRTRPGVQLTARAHELPTATVRGTHLRRRTLGRTATGGLARINFTQKDTFAESLGVGCEVGTILDLRGATWLEELRFYLSENHFQRLKLRVNLYSVQHGQPDSLLLGRDIRFEVVGEQTGWIAVDLQPYNLLLTQRRIAVTIQWLAGEGTLPDRFAPDTTRPIFQLPALFPAIGSKIVYRQRNQTAWQRFRAAPSLNVTVLDGK